MPTLDTQIEILLSHIFPLFIKKLEETIQYLIQNKKKLEGTILLNTEEEFLLLIKLLKDLLASVYALQKMIGHTKNPPEITHLSFDKTLVSPCILKLIIELRSREETSELIIQNHKHQQVLNPKTSPSYRIRACKFFIQKVLDLFSRKLGEDLDYNPKNYIINFAVALFKWANVPPCAVILIQELLINQEDEKIKRALEILFETKINRPGKEKEEKISEGKPFMVIF